MESCAQVEFPLLQGSYSQATHSSLPHLSPLSSLLLVFCRSLSLSVFLSLSLSLFLLSSPRWFHYFPLLHAIQIQTLRCLSRTWRPAGIPAIGNTT